MFVSHLTAVCILEENCAVSKKAFLHIMIQYLEKCYINCRVNKL